VRIRFACLATFLAVSRVGVRVREARAHVLGLLTASCDAINYAVRADDADLIFGTATLSRETSAELAGRGRARPEQQSDCDGGSAHDRELTIFFLRSATAPSSAANSYVTRRRFRAAHCRFTRAAFGARYVRAFGGTRGETTNAKRAPHGERAAAGRYETALAVDVVLDRELGMRLFRCQNTRLDLRATVIPAEPRP